MGIEGIQVLQSQPGHLSLAINKLKGNHSLAQEVQARFEAIRGITSVEVDPTRGEVQVQYEKEELKSLRSLLALKATVSFFLPEMNPLKLAAFFSEYL